MQPTLHSVPLNNAHLSVPLNNAHSSVPLPTVRLVCGHDPDNLVVGRLSEIADRVYQELGAGYPELIYKHAMAIEFQQQRILYQQEVVRPIHYRGHTIGHGYADFVIISGPWKVDRFIIEVKALSSDKNMPMWENQVRRYLAAPDSDITVGVVINFPQQF